MPVILSLQQYGNQLAVNMSDGTKLLAYPTSGGLWIINGSPEVTPPGVGGGTIYNPWTYFTTEVYGWEDHVSYSAGGDDFPLYNENIKSPAAGTLHTTGGTGEFAAGAIGSAGNRSVLYLDATVARVTAKSTTLMNGTSYEADGPLFALVFQHQSIMGTDLGHYNMGDVVGVSGNTNGTPGGGAHHLHIHGLDASGARVDFTKFIS